jgi:hypothetical protein
MASTVGQVIINARQTIPDMPQVVANPSILSATPIVDAVGGGTGPGPYAIVATLTTPYGETSASVNELTGTVAGPNNTLQVVVTYSEGYQRAYPIVTGVNVYVGTSAGNEVIKYSFPGSSSIHGVPLVLNDNASPTYQSPPQLNRAFNPDTDGGLVGASAIFGWLNDGLRVISRIAGGLMDYSGVPSVSNTPIYTMPGEWNAITSIWYDGYWMMGGDRGYFWRRNNITSMILSSATISIINNQMFLEVYPQPARTAAVTTLSAPMASSDILANLTSTAGFLLPFGFFQVDQEIMGYNIISGSQLTGLLRGLGGSAATSHLNGASVTELNIFWNGKRQIEPNYQPGQSSTILPLPSGWDVLLAEYISLRAKNIEHDAQYWQALDQHMKQSIADWARQNKSVARRRQVGPPSSPATFYNTPAGGLLIN